MTGLPFLLLLTTLPAAARDKDGTQYGTGLVVNIPYPANEVTRIVQDVIQNGIIRGTKEYNKDEYITGATAASSTRVFTHWTEGGKVFYKVRLKALDPRNFKNGGDLGTLAVRYVVQAQGDQHTVLRIDARFVEDFRRTAHPSNGSVEGAEYKDIHDRLESLELMKSQTAEAEKTTQQSTSKAVVITDESAPPKELHSKPADAPLAATDSTHSAPPDSTQSSPPAQTLEERVQELRERVERRVKSPGAPLKSAPFHTASTLQSLTPGTEVLIVISSPYWVGVETHEGQHGWILRDDLELVK
jgi:polyhydroxyalkanoate synthesis regulator phasin